MQSDDAPRSPEDRVSVSARGWHRVQLAVLGFIGLCGVLWGGGSHAAPASVQWLAAFLALAGLVLACIAIYLVGRVAHPFSGEAAATDHERRRLRTGVLTTYVAVGLVVVATLAGWWPSTTAEGSVEVQDSSGQVWCGELAAAPAGALALDTDDGLVTLATGDVRSVESVNGC